MREDIRQRIEIVRSGRVPEGYVLKTPYIMPLNWRRASLGNITTRHSRANTAHEDIPAYSINNKHGFIPQNEQFEEGSYNNLDKGTYKIVYRDEFAYNPARVNVGSIGLLASTEKAIVSSLYVCFSTTKQVSPQYLEEWFETSDFIREIFRNLEGSVREYLFYENFSRIRVPLPPVDEQGRISIILEKVNHILTIKHDFLAEKSKRKKWLLENLFNPDSGFRLKGFGGKWQLWSLGEVGTIQKGRGISNEDCKPNGTVSCVKYGDIYMNYDTYFAETVSHTDDEVARQSIFAQNGSLLFTCSGEDAMEIGKCVAYLGEEQIAVGGDIVILTLRPGFDPLFVAYQQSTISAIKEKATYSQGHSIVHLYGSQIKLLTLCCPHSLAEQRAIAHVLSTADREIDLLQQEIEQWQLLKKALSQLLLTGLVRV